VKLVPASENKEVLVAERVQLPAVFDPDRETDKFLTRIKKKAFKSFRWTSAQCLQNGDELAYWLYVFGRDEEALGVCRFLGQYQFAGNFSLWSPIERLLALQARLLQQRGEKDAATACVQRIRDAGFVASRLDGTLLHDEDVARAIQNADKTSERNWRLVNLGEQCFLLALGGAQRLPAGNGERQLQDNLTGLRALLGVKIPA
jgi:hypothetical protein